ncbi:MAG: hypothetical protein ACOZF0_23390 [Thermodesulfobacteriota bacterium]
MKSIGKLFIAALSGWMFFTICGCTVYPKPRLDNGYYKNFEYEFKFRLPGGWVAHNYITDEIAEGVAAEFAENFVFMLTNPETEGMILITAEKSEFDIVSIGYNKESLKEKILAKISEWEAQLAERYAFENYTYQLYPVEIAEGYGPTLIYSETANSLKGDNYARAYLLNRCSKEGTCSLQVTLISKDAGYDYNFKVFTDIVNSLIKVYK